MSLRKLLSSSRKANVRVPKYDRCDTGLYSQEPIRLTARRNRAEKSCLFSEGRRSHRSGR